MNVKEFFNMLEQKRARHRMAARARKSLDALLEIVRTQAATIDSLSARLADFEETRAPFCSHSLGETCGLTNPKACTIHGARANRAAAERSWDEINW